MSVERGWTGNPQPSVESLDFHYSRQADRESAAQYYVVDDDPLRALNVLREAAGLEPLSAGNPSEPADADGGM